MQDVNIGEWLNSLASRTPTPGGGAVAALVLAIAAAQLGMVAEYTTGPKWQDRQQRMEQLIRETAHLRTQALELVQQDAQAFASVGVAYKLPKDTEDQKLARQVAIQQALAQAAVPPTKTAILATRLVEISAEIAQDGNPSVISDVAVASSMARAALESAIVNIEINEHSIKDPTIKHSLQTSVFDASLAIEETKKVTQIVRKRMKS